MFKLVMIVFNITLGEEVQSLLNRLKVSCFTKWPRLEGRGITAGARFDNNIWPGANAAMMVVTTEEQAREILKEVDILRKTAGKLEGVKAFMMPVEDMTGEP